MRKTVPLLLALISLRLNPLLAENKMHQEQKKTTKSFCPPYSDPSYCCRCIPVPLCKNITNDTTVVELHQKICEYKSYVNELKRHAHFMIDLFSQKEESWASWFEEQGLFLKDMVIQNIENFLSWGSKTISEESRKELQALCVIIDNELSPENFFILTPGVISKDKNKKYTKSISDSILNCLQKAGISRKKSEKLLSWLDNAQTYIFLKKESHKHTLLKELQALLKKEKFFAEMFSEEINLEISIKEKIKKLISLDNVNAFIKEYWDFLEYFDPESGAFFSRQSTPPSLYELEKNISKAFILLKEFGVIATIVIQGYAQELFTELKLSKKERILHSRLTPGDSSILFQEMISVYNTVNKLPLRETVEALNNLTSSIKKTVTAFKEEEEKKDASWQKTLWFKLPFALGVVAVKIFEHYCNLSVAIDTNEQNFSLFGKTNNKPSIFPFGGGSLTPSPFQHPLTIKGDRSC